jgi:hypothetical protein
VSGESIMTAAVPRAFFSYSRQDSEFVLQLASDLRTAGAAVWLDQLDIEPGQRWDSAVERALASCPRMLVVLSPASVDSTNVMDEVSFALEENKQVIPILYRDCKLPFRLRRVQYIDARTDADYRRGLKELVSILGAETPEVAGQFDPGAIGAAVHSVTNTNMTSTNAEGGHAERARTAVESGAADAAKAQQRAEPDRIAREETHAAHVGGPLEHAWVREAELSEAQRPVPSTRAIEPAPSNTRRTLPIVGVAVVVLLAAAIGIWKIPKPGGKSSGPAPSYQPPIVTPPNSVVTAEPQPSTKPSLPEPTAGWVTEFVQAAQGPLPEALRPYFHDAVTPYYREPSADWAAIAKDKTSYFTHYPTIRYTVLGEPRIRATDQASVVDLDVAFDTVRADGSRVTGTRHWTMKVKSVDGAWKIVGIQECAPAAAVRFGGCLP